MPFNEEFQDYDELIFDDEMFKEMEELELPEETTPPTPPTSHSPETPIYNIKPIYQSYNSIDEFMPSLISDIVENPFLIPIFLLIIMIVDITLITYTLWYFKI